MNKKGKISAMSLGTVQLGMNYGIANMNGKPDEKSSFAMLDGALSGGVTSIDTAQVYGESEAVIGRFFKQYKGEIPFMTTKLPKIQGDTQLDIDKYVVSSIEKSLETLGLKKVNCVMLHVAGDLTANGDKTAKAMERIVKMGYTDMVGASVYVTEEVEEMLKSDVYTATQLPMSIFDQRIINSGALKKLHDKNYTVFIRSVFLQGLFFLDPENITDPILAAHAKERLIYLRKIAEREGMSVAQLAIAYIRDMPGVTSLVLGADTKEQVEANIAYFETPGLSEDTMNEIKVKFADVDIPEIMKVLSRPKK